MGSLLPKLLKLLGDEYKMQTGMKKQLDAQTKAWAREAREVSYQMEDVLDTFLVHVQEREPASPSRLRHALQKMVSLFRKGKANRDIGYAIKDIKNRLQHLANRRARYRIDDIIANPTATMSTVDPRLQAMYNEVAKLVGINKPRDDLICKLSAQGDDMALPRKIVSIFGTGGLGKTTLAKAVYEKLRPDFQFGAFVPVGRNPNIAKILMDILYDLDKNKYADIHTKNRDERQLTDSLREFLTDKRYFIVIDDIWETKSWEETIGFALVENNRGSRIIITTRNSQVASRISDEVYRMQPLSEDNSKKLFYTRIFGPKEKCPDNEPDKISNKILKKCDGVPLAIITMASLLVGKPSERWSDVFTSIGFGQKDDKQVENTMKILSYSYYDMPSHLRTCLLYLSIFPEDYTIDKNSLIWKWIAEAFIQERQGIRLFELGDIYFNDLINRSMIQAIDSLYPCEVNGCHVHDMVLDLIRSISSEENFVTILGKDEDEGTVTEPSSSARRLAKHNDTMEYSAHVNVAGVPQLRSFITFKCSIDKWVVLLSSFGHLRVLNMEGSKNVRSSHLVHLGILIHLRYLGLQQTWIDELPNEIGALKLLQTLNLDNTRIRQLTPSISRLSQLMLTIQCGERQALSPHDISEFCIWEASNSHVCRHGLVPSVFPTSPT
ncbi:hypothetical protein PR202_gb13604 [Eleusine coracana subsp. coracana]|uniref:AAA+ ATPase domain-containing protein n=1 Tax=Eleusine coracana subsp. coracana TaxID=191504 RepID=A0AAV5EQS6_ELECO|nr:hypothetical protein PR202_gb13604 [Eleusine coracana subsp. coracana]